MREKLKRKGKFYVYILECVDKTYYTGYTPNLKKRIELHNNGKGAKYTRDRRPVELVYAKEYKYYKRALNKEREIKGMIRQEKEILIKIYEKAREAR